MTPMLPTPFDDELAKGYRGRLKRLNEFSDIPRTPQLKKAENRHPPPISLDEISGFARMTAGEFVTRHSMLPLYLAIGKGSKFETSGSKNWVVVPQTGVKACRACINSDRTGNPISYWRRSHQIFGVDWCAEHGEPLFLAEGKYAESPPEFADLISLESAKEIGGTERSNPVLQRLHRLQVEWLATPDAVHPLIACKTIQARCEALGLRIGRQGKRLLLSDLVREKVPHSWIARHFPGLPEKAQGEFFKAIDGVGADSHRAFPVIAYAIAFATLFASVADINDAIPGSATNSLAVGDSNWIHLPAMKPSVTLEEVWYPSEKVSPQTLGAVDQAILAFLAGASIAEACGRYELSRDVFETACRHRLQEIGNIRIDPRGNPELQSDKRLNSYLSC